MSQPESPPPDPPAGTPDAARTVLVIGGGIVGAGIARDAAMRGMDVTLVEQYDFAFGTSSRSSRLIHGGLRYLAQGRLGLVREASREKAVLMHIAPHLCEPLAFVFPTRRGTPWWKLKLSAGVMLYDWLCGSSPMPSSTRLSEDDTLRRVPGLNPVGLTGAVRYYDGFTNDARLVMDTLRSAARHGARLLNYHRLVGARPRGPYWDCTVKNLLTGETSVVHAYRVVSAAGAWSNRLPHHQALLRPTRGIHLVVQRERLPIPDAVVMTEGKRVLFALPWNQRVILGTTDTDYRGEPEAPGVDSEDVEYILDVTNAAFPQANLTEVDILSTWTGLRPLVGKADGTPSDMSRRHEITQTEPGWFEVTGGKLTTYRLMAEQAVDALAAGLSPYEACRTDEETLVDDARFSRIYPPEPGREAVEYYCRHEWVVHLDDLMIRRTSWRHYFPHQDALAEQAAGWMQELLKWDDARREAELARYRRIVADPSWYQPTLEEA